MSDTKARIELWPMARMLPHPDNPRTVNTKSPKFVELIDSIRANGVIEALVVRNAPGQPGYIEILSGHRRFIAAEIVGLDTLPIQNKGDISDEIAFDIVALTNLHEELTPLEEGKRAATWLDKYHGDAKAVAGKLGKSERWVHEHAQIYRGLLVDWQKMAMEEEWFGRWTASHWAVIAKLPARIQAEHLAKFLKGQYVSYNRWSVKYLEDVVRIETFQFAKAPFDTKGCQKCLSRSGVQPLLWGDTVEEASGEKEKCLDKKCWLSKCQKAERAKFKALAEEKGVPDAVPISTMEEPKGWEGKQEYQEKVSGLRKVHKNVVTLGQAKIVKEGTKGAVAAIVVAGKGKGSVKYIKVNEKKESSRGGGQSQPTAAELKRRKEGERWQIVCRQGWDMIGKTPVPELRIQLFLMLTCFSDLLFGEDREAVIHEGVQHWAKGAQAFDEWLATTSWTVLREQIDGCYVDSCYTDEGDRVLLAQIGVIFHLDLPAMYSEVERAEKENETLAQHASCDGDPQACAIGCTPCLAADCDSCIVTVAFPKSYQTSAIIHAKKVDGAWCGHYDLSVKDVRIIDHTRESYESKEECLRGVVGLISKFSDIDKRLQPRIVSRIEEAVEEHIAKEVVAQS